MKVPVNINKEEAQKLSMLPIVEIGDNYEVIRLNPKELLTPVNFVDILAKYMYGKARRDGTLTQWVLNLYIKHLFVRNKLFDGVERASASAFVNSFNELLDSVEREGFNEKKSIIALTRNMDLLDGAHRAAAAMVYGKEVVVLKTETKEYEWGPDFFRKKGFEAEYLDQTALEYCKINLKARLAIIFPIVKDKYGFIKDTFRDHIICYEKDYIPTINGIGNLIAQMYKPKDWLDAGTRDRHAIRRFIEGEPVRVLLLNPKNQEELVKTKVKIRSMFNHENLPIHTSDDHEETVRVAEQVFNGNSLHFFDYSHPTKFENFSSLFSRYKSWIEKNQFNKEEFCVDGSAVMAAYGLRDCGDLDYISFSDKRSDLDRVRSHNDFLYLHDRPLKELIFDPRNYFYYDGYKFLTLDRVIRMKKMRKDTQDKRDVELMLKIPKSRASSKSSLFMKPENVWNYTVMRAAHVMWKIYLLLPKRVRPLAVKTYHIVKRIHRTSR